MSALTSPTEKLPDAPHCISTTVRRGPKSLQLSPSVYTMRDQSGKRIASSSLLPLLLLLVMARLRPFLWWRQVSLMEWPRLSSGVDVDGSGAPSMMPPSSLSSTRSLSQSTLLCQWLQRPNRKRSRLPLASVWVTFSNGQNSYTYLFGQTVQVRRHKRERMQENDKRAGLDHN